MKIKNNIIIISMLIVTVFIMYGCAQIQSVNDNRVVCHISILPIEITLAPGGNQQFKAYLYDQNNDLITEETPTIIWSTSTEVGTITQNGTFSATAVGWGYIFAECEKVNGLALVKIIDGTPPSDFNMDMATNEVIIANTKINISWTPSGSIYNGMKEYKIMAYRLGSGSEIFGAWMSDISPETTSVDFNMGIDGIWKIKVRAEDNKGLWTDSDGKNCAGKAGDPDKILTVIADSIPPGPLTLASPFDGQYYDTRKVKIWWNTAEDVNLDHYKVCIGTDQDDVLNSSVYLEEYPINITSCEANLPGGIYYIYIVAYDMVGHYRDLSGKTDIAEYDMSPGTIYEGKWPCFEIDHEPPVITYAPNELYPPPVSNPYFSPNGDGIKDTTTINYSVTDDAYLKIDHKLQDEFRIDVKIEMVRDGIVYRSWRESLPPGWHSKEWDGKNDLGSIVAKGPYTVKIIATDGALNYSIDESQTITVDN